MRRKSAEGAECAECEEGKWAEQALRAWESLGGETSAQSPRYPSGVMNSSMCTESSPKGYNTAGNRKVGQKERVSEESADCAESAKNPEYQKRSKEA